MGAARLLMILRVLAYTEGLGRPRLSGKGRQVRLKVKLELLVSELMTRRPGHGLPSTRTHSSSARASETTTLTLPPPSRTLEASIIKLYGRERLPRGFVDITEEGHPVLCKEPP